jgi:hypothetical protein
MTLIRERPQTSRSGGLARDRKSVDHCGWRRMLSLLLSHFPFMASVWRNTVSQDVVSFVISCRACAGIWNRSMSTARRCKSAAITVIEPSYGGVPNFLPNVGHVHQHLLALFRMTVFGIVFAFLIENSEQMSRFMSHRAVGAAVGDQRDPLRRLRASERP